MAKVEYIIGSCLCHAVIWALIIQLNIFKYIDGISKKFVPNFSIDEEVSLWGNRMELSRVIYHDGEQSHCAPGDYTGHYSPGVNMEKYLAFC